MGLISLYRKYAFVDYQNHLCSFASLVTLLVILISIFVPFALIYKVNNWKFSSTDDLVIYEQPFVKFQYKYMMIVEHSLENERKTILCSSFSYLHQHQEDMERCSKIKVLEYDDNYDGVTDEIRLSFDFHSAFKFGIKSFSIVLFLDARLRDQCNFRVPATMIVNKKILPNNFNDRKILINGNMNIHQNFALICPFFMRNVKTHFFFENLNENQTNFQEYELAKIEENLQRNPAYIHFQETSMHYQELDADKTTIELHLKIPELPARYKKSIWQKVNDIWINFLALFFITFLIANFLLNRLFESHLLWARKKHYSKDKEL
ncbi:unnamed protein product [Diamesa hyperborea]